MYMFTTAAEFQGFHRADGTVGLRNHVLVLSTVALTARLAALAAQAVPGAVLVAGDYPRGLRGPDAGLQARVIAALIRHPNVGAALVLCHDMASRDAIAATLADAGRPVVVQAFMAASGMADAVAQAQSAVVTLAAEIDGAKRQSAPISALRVALECGGSDATSALAANPAIGRVVDALVAHGATAIVSETSEFVGAESIVAAQAESPQAAREILAALARSEAELSEDGESYRGVNPTAENIAAGLTTLVEKSMGAVNKIGRSPLRGALAFGEPPRGPGLWFMDTPFFSPISLTGMVAAGAQVTLFAMGVFNPSGNPLAPTLKICGNRQTLARWSDSIDVDVSAAIHDGASLDQMGESIARALLQTASGSVTCAETWQEGQVMIPTTRSLL
jgi:altronate dehydratase large subunit